MGDIDLDGFDDLAILSAQGYSPGGVPLAGDVRVVSAASGQVLVVVPNPFPTPAMTANVNFMALLEDAGDHNSDGIPDILLRRNVTILGISQVVTTEIVSGADGSTIRFLPFGTTAIVKVSDRDGDGLADFLIGLPFQSPVNGVANSGVVRVASSVTGQTLLQIDGLVAWEAFGNSLDVVGDVDGDSVEDFVIGAPGSGLNPVATHGTVRVFSGVNGQLLWASPPGQTGMFLGWQIAGVGDIDGDGVIDAAAATLNAGILRVYSGIDGTLLFESDPGPNVTCSEFGKSIAGGGDVDGDGVPDILVGAPRYSPSPQLAGAGAVFVISGVNGEILRIITGDAGVPGAWPVCVASQGLGMQVAMLGDVNGDGLSDFAASAPSQGGSNIAGWVRAFAGIPAPIEACRLGNVNTMGVGGTTDVLSIDRGITGLRSVGIGPQRRLNLNVGEPLSIWMASPPAGPVVAHYVLWGQVTTAAPTTSLPISLPAGVGDMCFAPKPLGVPGDPTLFTLIDAFSFSNQVIWGLPAVGAGIPVAFLAQGVPFPVAFNLQGVMQDASAAFPNIAVTNAIHVVVQ